MAAPKKTFRLFSEPEVDSYSSGSYSPGEIEERGKVYVEKSRKLVDALELDGTARELLLIYINHHSFIKTFEEKPDWYSELYEIRKNPYDVASTVIEPVNELSYAGGFFSGLCNKDGLLNHIDSYIERNMDYIALGVVHPSLVDFVCMLVEDRYNTQLLEIDPDKVKKSILLEKENVKL